MYIRRNSFFKGLVHLFAGVLRLTNSENCFQIWAVSAITNRRQSSLSPEMQIACYGKGRLGLVNISTT
jgi:hypothetical protein